MEYTIFSPVLASPSNFFLFTFKDKKFSKKQIFPQKISCYFAGIILY